MDCYKRWIRIRTGKVALVMPSMSEAQEDKGILSEGEIVITESYVAVAGKRFAWSDLGFVQIAKPAGWLSPAFSKRRPVYELRVAKKGRPATDAIAIFSTRDAGLVTRIQRAMDEVARRRG